MAEISASYYGYSGQCFCGVTLGEPTDELAEMHALATELYGELCDVVRPGNGDQEVLQVAGKIRDRGLDIEAPLVHAWGTHFGLPAIGMENWGEGVTEGDVVGEGLLIVIAAEPVATPVRRSLVASRSPLATNSTRIGIPTWDSTSCTARDR